MPSTLAAYKAAKTKYLVAGLKVIRLARTVASMASPLALDWVYAFPTGMPGLPPPREQGGDVRSRVRHGFAADQWCDGRQMGDAITAAKAAWDELVAAYAAFPHDERDEQLIATPNAIHAHLESWAG